LRGRARLVEGDHWRQMAVGGELWDGMDMEPPVDLWDTPIGLWEGCRHLGGSTSFAVRDELRDGSYS
jgi:hypothetical protein